MQGTVGLITATIRLYKGEFVYPVCKIWVQEGNRTFFIYEKPELSTYPLKEVYNQDQVIGENGYLQPASYEDRDYGRFEEFGKPLLENFVPLGPMHPSLQLATVFVNYFPKIAFTSSEYKQAIKEVEYMNSKRTHFIDVLERRKEESIFLKKIDELEKLLKKGRKNLLKLSISLGSAEIYHNSDIYGAGHLRTLELRYVDLADELGKEREYEVLNPSTEIVEGVERSDNQGYMMLPGRNIPTNNWGVHFGPINGIMNNE